MAVIYKGSYKIDGVVRHGAPAEPEVPQTIFLNTFEEGTPIGNGLGWYFSRMFTSYVVTSGDTGSASVNINDGSMTGNASGNASNYSFMFSVTGTDSQGSETLTFIYEVVPVRSFEQDYVVDYDNYVAVFAPRWTEGEPVNTVSGSGGPNQEIDFSEQLVLDGPLPGPQDDYVWSGTLVNGLTLSSDGVVSGTLTAEQDTDYGIFPVTVTNGNGHSAVLQLRIEVYILL